VDLNVNATLDGDAECLDGIAAVLTTG